MARRTVVHTHSALTFHIPLPHTLRLSAGVVLLAVFQSPWVFIPCSIVVRQPPIIGRGHYLYFTLICGVGMFVGIFVVSRAAHLKSIAIAAPQQRTGDFYVLEMR